MIPIQSIPVTTQEYGVQDLFTRWELPWSPCRKFLILTQPASMCCLSFCCQKPSQILCNMLWNNSDLFIYYSPNSLLLGFLMQLEIWPPWCWLVWSVSWALKWSCLPLSLPISPVVSLYVWGGCWLVWPPSWALKWSCLPLSPVVSLHVGGGGWLVWPHLEQKYSEIKITGFNLNLLTVNCLGSTLV